MSLHKRSAEIKKSRTSILEEFVIPTEKVKLIFAQHFFVEAIRDLWSIKKFFQRGKLTIITDSVS